MPRTISEKARRIAPSATLAMDAKAKALKAQGISVVSFAAMGMVFLYLLEPAARKLAEKINRNTLYIICLSLLFLFLADSFLSALFRTPITY